MSDVKTLSTSEINTAQQQAAVIAGTAKAPASGGQFVFFAAFDGTNNDKDDLALAGNPNSTNVAQLFDQVQSSGSLVKLERSDSPWYPSVRLFRQSSPGDWYGPLREVAQALPAQLNHVRQA